MKLIKRLELLEARAPKALKRVVLVWVSPDGCTIKAADTHPHLPDDREYTSYLTPYRPGGGIGDDVAQAN
jgi:hypothetical protein